MSTNVYLDALAHRARAAIQGAGTRLRGEADEPLLSADGQQQVVEIVPPLENTHDAQVVETLLASVAAGQPFSLEIAATAGRRSFLVRGQPATLSHVAHQLRAAYGQIEVEELAPEDDPAESIRQALAATHPAGAPTQQAAEAGPSKATACGQLRLERPVFYPLRTYREFESGDPITTLLGSFAGLRPGEVALSQLVLSPAPDGWADSYQKSDLNTKTQQMTITGQLVPATFAGGIVSLVIAGFLLLAFRHSWLAQGLVWLGLVGVLTALTKIGMKAQEWLSIDPQVTRRKTNQPGYYTDLRLWAVSDTPDNARQVLARLASAFRLFNIAEGNRLQLYVDDAPAAGDPLDLALSPSARANILNVTELAGMWHLPLGENPDQVKRKLYRRFLPAPSTVDGPGSARAGYSIKDGQQVPVSLSAYAVQHNVMIVGKTQKGKSTLMGHIATNLMARPKHSLVVIAPHRDLADWLCTVVPQAREDDVVMLDLSRSDRIAGLNLIDVATLNQPPDKIVSDLNALGQAIWTDNWGPRMEDAFSNAALTLAHANCLLPPEDQFTVLDIPATYVDDNFTDNLLEHFVTDQKVRRWWLTEFRPKTAQFRSEVTSPVLTKIGRFARARSACYMVGQSKSTLDLHQVLACGKILLVNTAAGEIGLDVGGFLGAVILNHLSAVIREQIALPPEQRARVTVIIDEFQSVPGVDYASLLAELLKMGANFVLGTQSLTQLDKVDPQLKGAIFANVDTTAAFQCSGEDAQYLFYELDGVVQFTDLTNLDPHRCYVKTVDDQGHRLPVYDMVTLKPEDGLPETARRIQDGMTRYTTPAAQVKAAIDARQTKWYPLSGRAQGAQETAQKAAQGKTGMDVFDEYLALLSDTSDTVGQDDNAEKPEEGGKGQEGEVGSKK